MHGSRSQKAAGGRDAPDRAGRTSTMTSTPPTQERTETIYRIHGAMTIETTDASEAAEHSRCGRRVTATTGRRA